MDKPNTDVEPKLTDDLTVDDNYDGTEYLGHEVETYLQIDQLTGRDKLHLPLLYDVILDNLDVATPEQIAILLRAMGRPSDTPTKRKAYEEKRILKAQLEVMLTFSRNKATGLHAKSGKEAIISFFETLEPSNRTEQFYKNKYNDGANIKLDSYQFDELYKAAKKLLNDTKMIVP